MVNPLHNHLDIAIVNDAAEACTKGFDYNANNAKAAAAGQAPIQPIEVKQVLVVRCGTESGKSTVDFILENEIGERYVFMVTGALLKSIPC